MGKSLQKIFIVYLLVIVGAFNAFAVIHKINVSSNSYSPKDITINKGDTLEFVFGGGTHPTSSETGDWDSFTLSNTNKTKTIFTNNFALGQHKYFCDLHGGAGGTGMAGTFTVQGTTRIRTLKEPDYEFEVGPNPITDKVFFKVNAGDKNLKGIKIFDIIGNEIFALDLTHKEYFKYELDFSSYRPGIYFCNLYCDKGILETKKLFYR